MAVSKKVLLIESDAVLRTELAAQIALDGEFEVSASASVDEALQNAQSALFDITLLGGNESGLDMDGLPLPLLTLITPTDKQAGSLNERGPEKAATMLARGETMEKPIHIPALLSRLRALISQYERSDEAAIQIGPFTFQPAFRRLINTSAEKSEPKPISLTDKESAILHYLYRASGAPVSRDELLDKVWNYHKGASTHTLETHIYRLRQKIEAELAGKEILRTEPDGYRLNLSE